MLHMCRAVWQYLIKNTIAPKGLCFCFFFMANIIQLFLLLGYMFLSAVSNYEYLDRSYEVILKLLYLSKAVWQAGVFKEAKLHSLLVWQFGNFSQTLIQVFDPWYSMKPVLPLVASPNPITIEFKESDCTVLKSYVTIF